MKLRTEAPVNGGRNYNGPKVSSLALVKSGYMLEGLSIPRYAKCFEGHGFSHAVTRTTWRYVTMRWVQIISRKGQWEIRTHKVRGRARLQSCRNGGKISRALAPEVALPILLESSETICQIPTQIGKDIVRTAWRHAESGRNVHSAWSGESSLSG